MAKYPFLSDEWMAAAKEIRESAAGASTPPAHKVKMNMVITEVPDGVGPGGDINAHMDTSEGELKMDQGHVEGEDLTVTVDYATAKAIFIDGNPQAGMQAFMEGKVKLQGDLTKLMAAQVAGTGPGAPGLADALSDITE